MAKRKIVKLGEDEILRKRCRTVTAFDDRLASLLDDMTETLHIAQGAGLAAPQVGLLRRAVIIELDNKHYELVNPEIIAQEGTQTEIEGCLSVPGRAGRVERPAKVTVKAQDRHGEWYEVTGEGMLACCLCHELDHLDGVLYIDKMIEDVSDRYTVVGGKD